MLTFFVKKGYCAAGTGEKSSFGVGISGDKLYSAVVDF